MSTVSVVTGAGGAMGTACARRLAAIDDVLVLSDIDESRLQQTAEAIAALGGARVEVVVADLGDPDAGPLLAARARDRGSFHALVHTAGLSPAMAPWQEILRVDLVGVARVLDAFLPLVGPSSVAVCLASIAGHLGVFDATMDALLDDVSAPDLESRFLEVCGPDPASGVTYRLAKRAVIRLCERAAVDWGARGGRVVSVSPGLIDTGMGRLELEENPIKHWMAEITPLGPSRRTEETILPGRVDDIASAVGFVVSDAAAFVSGCDLRVDGGLVGAMDHLTRE